MRFASEPYSGGEESLANHYVHLTNFALNRDNTVAGAAAEDGSPASCKWSLPSLRRHLETAGLVPDWAWLWAELRRVCAAAVLCGHYDMISAWERRPEVSEYRQFTHTMLIVTKKVPKRYFHSALFPNSH